MDKKTEEFLNDKNVADDSLEESNELDSFADQKPKKSKKPLLVVIIILLLVGASLGAAYKWYGQISEYQSKQEESNKQIDQLQKQVAELKSTKTSEGDTKGAEVQIKEWGVSLDPLNAGVVSYQIKTDNPDIADFVSSQQKALGGDCGSFSSSRYHVFRAKKGYVTTDDVFSSGLKNAETNNRSVKIGENTYYILYDMSGGDCSGKLKEGDSVSKAETSVNDNLLAALKSLKESN